MSTLPFLSFAVVTFTFAGVAAAQAKPGGTVPFPPPGSIPQPPKPGFPPAAALPQGGKKPASAPAPAAGQQPGKPPAKKDGDKEIAALIAEMAKLVAAKKDDDAIMKLDELVKRFDDCGPKDKKLVADGVMKNFDANRQPEEGSNGGGGGRDGNKEEPEQAKLYQSSIVALSQFHELGCERLLSLYERTDFKRAKRFRGRIIQMIGKTEQVSAVKFVLDKLKDKDDIIVHDAIIALANFTKAKEEVRKEIIDKLVKEFNSSHSQASDPSTPPGKVAKDRYELIAPAVIDTLQRLSNQSALRDPREWEKWWQNNKKKPLD